MRLCVRACLCVCAWGEGRVFARMTARTHSTHWHARQLACTTARTHPCTTRKHTTARTHAHMKARTHASTLDSTHARQHAHTKARTHCIALRSFRIATRRSNTGARASRVRESMGCTAHGPGVMTGAGRPYWIDSPLLYSRLDQPVYSRLDQQRQPRVCPRLLSAS